MAPMAGVWVGLEPSPNVWVGMNGPQREEEVTMRYRYFTCDVFTDTRFGGNPLAVLPEAQPLDEEQMQQVAREFNFSETAFVLPPLEGGTRRVRIFTPTSELPFAGHPNIGTAFILTTMGALSAFGASTTVTFEQKAGRVPITIRMSPAGHIQCELRAPEGLSLGRTFSPEQVASAVHLDGDDIVTASHLPQVASVGLPFLLAELRDRNALTRANPNLQGFERLVAEGLEPPYIHLYVKSEDAFDIRARMFAPFDGPPEDPATGSANCALVALLSHLNRAPGDDFRWRIAQGVEMGRPSVLEARTEKRAGEVVSVWIGGECVLVSEGWIEV
jgi:trans-2,3-dihydro-3-hydroxyanthranilate isomerase